MADDKPKSTLPVFKPSGSGLGRDLLGLEHMKVQAEAWWAGQFKLYLKKLAPIVTVNGLKVYNSRIIVGPGACGGGDVSEFLDIIGFDDRGKEQLCKTQGTKGVDYVYFHWVSQYTIDHETFGITYRQIVSQLPNFHSIEVLSTVTARHAGPYVTTNTTSIRNINTLRPDGGDLNLGLENIKLFDVDGIDITAETEANVLRVLISLLYISGDRFLNRLSTTLHSAIQYQQVVGGDGDIYPYVYRTWAKVTTKETYGNQFNPDFYDEEDIYRPPGLFSTVCDSYIPDECTSNFVPVNKDGGYDYGALSNIMAAEIWKYREELHIYDINDNERGIFTSTRDNNGKVQMYMIVDNLENTSPRELQEIIANNAKLSIKKKSSGFFSGVLSSIMGAFNAILSVISEIGYYIPLIRVQMQAIMWAANGGKSWHQSKEEYIAQSNMLIIAAMSAIVTVLSFGKAGPGMKAFYAAMLAYNAYSTTQNLEAFRDSIEYNKAMAELDAAEKKLIEDALEDETNLIDIGDEFKVKEEFMPLDEDLKEIEQPLFGDGSELEIKLTEGK